VGGGEKRNFSWLQTKEGGITIKVVRRSINPVVSCQSGLIIKDSASRGKG